MAFSVTMLQYDLHLGKANIAFSSNEPHTTISLFQLPFDDEGAHTKDELEEKIRREARRLLEALVQELPQPG